MKDSVWFLKKLKIEVNMIQKLHTHTHTHAYVYTIEYYLALKKELVIHALTRMSLEDVMLGE